jgi:hypothetical protein
VPTENAGTRYFWEHRIFETVEAHCEQFDGGIAKPLR